MKRNILLQVLCFTIFSVSAQQRAVYAVRPLTETERIKKESIREWQIPQGKSLSTNPLPSGIDNSLLNYFPPIFNQRGNSCSQASGVRYAFTYEINRLLDREGKTPDHIFSYHFSWNYLNNGKDEGSHPELGYDILKASGAATQTDMNDESAATSATTWMNGYDKYLRAMKYRVKEYAQFTLKTPEGIARLKQFLYNRGEEGSAGGVVTFSCKSSDWRTEPYKGESATGLETILTRIGTDGAHALTIVGYDDKVEFDLDRNGSITDDEKGAFIIANSWGTWWASQGKCYYPYKFFLLPAHEGGAGRSGCGSSHGRTGNTRTASGFQNQTDLYLTQRPLLPVGSGRGTGCTISLRQFHLSSHAQSGRRLLYAWRRNSGRV